MKEAKGIEIWCVCSNRSDGIDSNSSSNNYSNSKGRICGIVAIIVVYVVSVPIIVAAVTEA